MPDPTSPDCAAHVRQIEIVITQNPKMLLVFMRSPDNPETEVCHGLQSIQIQDWAIALHGFHPCSLRLGCSPTKRHTHKKQHERRNNKHWNPHANRPEKQAAPRRRTTNLHFICTGYPCGEVGGWHRRPGLRLTKQSVQIIIIQRSHRILLCVVAPTFRNTGREPREDLCGHETAAT